jgi:hypothetical protein
VTGMDVWGKLVTILDQSPIIGALVTLNRKKHYRAVVVIIVLIYTVAKDI